MSDLDQRLAREQARAKLFGRTEAVVQIGRFLVLESLGAGGMGQVYAAYDPELDRKVAIKVLHADYEGEADTVRDGTEANDATAAGSPRTGDAEQRLLREAQALARLAHPNVVTVYEVGTQDRQVFVAMELVKGVTTRAWLEQTSPTWRDALAVYVAAGRGLCAAHGAGIVHRDFKPDNVIVGDDGRVRVLDFGLARPHAEASDAVTEDDLQERSSTKNALLTPLTRTGAVVGTPAYMAPEQFLGRPVDAATDQFALCLCLYEALWGTSAFSGDRPAARMVEVVEGRVRDPPAGLRIPGRVRRAVLRGLAKAPADRWPSIAALLRELERDPWVLRRRAGLGLLAVGGVAVGVAGVGREDVDVCPDPAPKLAGIWDDATRSSALAAFTAAGADRIVSDVLQGLDAYASAWVEGHRDACRATNVRGEQSAELLDVRMACLDRRLAALRVVAGRVAEADAAAARAAPDALERLPPIDDCADLERLASAEEAPEDPKLRAAVAPLRTRLVELEVEAALSGTDAALVELRTLAATAESLNYMPLRGEVALLGGRMLVERGDLLEAFEPIGDALHHAEQGAAHRLAAEAATYLIIPLGFIEGARIARLQAALAEAKIMGIGGDPALEIERVSQLAGALSWEGQQTEAAALLDGIAPLARAELRSDSLALGDLSFRHGRSLMGAWRNTAALTAFSDALGVFSARLVADHPRYVELWTWLGWAKVVQGRHEDGLRDLRRALALSEQLEPAPWRDLWTLRLLSQALARTPGGLTEAGEHIERAVSTARELDRVGHIAGGLGDYGRYLLKVGRDDEAKAALTEALPRLRRHLGPKHASLVWTLHPLGELELFAGRCETARPYFDESLEILGRAEFDSPWRSLPLMGQAACRLRAGDVDGAAERLAIAHAALIGVEPPPEVSAGMDALWAAVVHARGGDDPLANELAERARDGFRSVGDERHAGWVDTVVATRG